MGFDDIPEDREESFPCPHCDDGNVIKDGDVWKCHICDKLPQVEQTDPKKEQENENFRREVKEFADVYIESTDGYKLHFDFEDESPRAEIELNDYLGNKWVVPICLDPFESDPVIAIDTENGGWMTANAEGLYFYLWHDAIYKLSKHHQKGNESGKFK